MKTSEDIKEIATALAKAQSTMGHAAKDANNPFFNSKYANLASVIDASREALSTNGLSISQGPHSTDGVKWVIVTKLSHSSGQWYETETPIILSKQDAQGFGSGMTYARRYGMSAIIGLTQDDDDAIAATNKTVPQKAAEKPGNLHKPAAESAGMLVNKATTAMQTEALKSPVAASKPPEQAKAQAKTPESTTGRWQPSEAQVKRMYAIAYSRGLTKDIVDRLVLERLSKKAAQLLRPEYEALCTEFEMMPTPQRAN